ncbi:MAG: Ig-like domain-containing protein, partial [Bacteroidota bacterium]
MLRALPLLFCALLASCATPTAPSGGPDDTTPPALVSTSPEAGAVRVASGDVVLTFSERLDPAGIRAVQVTPESETPPEVEIRGREIRITLDSLREATTYVVTVSTDLRDARRVPLRQPITFAFATGDVLDQGRIPGRVRTPETGAAASGVAIWAYAADPA